uniref:Uncharacterized protein LOC108048253 n=1 Tax=Drosophila rhopaloa TaxID=1041015 RepID=A0A6P4FFF8_DRORH
MDDDKLVSDEVHMRQLSATPSSAFSLQQRRQSNSVTHSAPPELTQRGGAGAGVGDPKEEAPRGEEADPDERVVLRRAVEKGAIALAQIDDLKLEGDDDDDDDGEEDEGLGLSNPAAQTTDDEQITVKGAGTGAAVTTITSSAATADASCEDAATTKATTIATPDMSKIPRLPGDGAQMEDTGDLPPSLQQIFCMISNLCFWLRLKEFTRAVD